MKLADFRRFFADEQDEQSAIRMELAREIQEWASSRYHPKFMRWLEDQASKSMMIGTQHMDLVQAAVRANTLREVRAFIERSIRDAEAAVRESIEDVDGR